MQLLQHLELTNLPKLGVKGKKTDFRTLLFENYVSLPSIPTYTNNRDKVTSIGMMCNDRLGDCTEATSGHAIQACSANNGNQIIIPDADIIKQYSLDSGYDPKNGTNDNGCYDLDVIKRLAKDGLNGHKILAYTTTGTKRLDMIKASIYILGGVRLCALLPISLQNQFIWSDPFSNLSGDNEPGSWGGHSFLGVDFDENYLYVISWGKICKVEWGWWKAYGNEVHPCLLDDWIIGGKAPNGLYTDALLNDVQALRAA